MAKTKAEKITSIDEEIRQLTNKKKRLIQEQKEQERKDRTNRLCKRMGLFEKLLPDTIPLTEEQFKTFLEQTVLTEHSRRILDGLTAQNAATAPAQGAETAGRGNKPSIQRRRTAQTGARCRDNGLAKRGRGVLFSPALLSVTAPLSSILSADEGLQRGQWKTEKFKIKHTERFSKFLLSLFFVFHKILYQQFSKVPTVFSILTFSYPHAHFYALTHTAKPSLS